MRPNHPSIPKTSDPKLSGARFAVTYRIAGEERTALERARGIAIEQTVEFPPDLVPEGILSDEIIGRIETSPNSTVVRVSYAVETAGNELPQLLNVIFGNSSIKPGIRVESLDLGDAIHGLFHGPRFGREGLRALFEVSTRPLLCTALKPMGLSAMDLATLAGRFALGGIDIIKDDHGLANQPFAPFEERVSRCAHAVAEANAETGFHCVYAPNVTAGEGETVRRARFAKANGAGALLVSPGLCSFDTMRAIAEDDSIALPVIGHPALLGAFVTDSASGISQRALFGQLMRLAGADASIFPSFGGRFSFTREDCQELVHGTEEPMGSLRAIFPAPGGGMTLDRLPELLAFYGRDVVFLIGGGLFHAGPDVTATCRRLRDIAETA